MPHPAQEIDLDRFATAHSNHACVIDVREPDEYAAGHVRDAVLMPMGEVATRTDELDKKAPVHVICASGNRSATVTDFLNREGFEAYSVAGGTNGWERLGMPLDPGPSGLPPTSTRPSRA